MVPLRRRRNTPTTFDLNNKCELIKNQDKAMTEEEKKEFEEFLKWKAEKARLIDSTKTEESAEISVDAEEVNEPENANTQINTMPNGDANKDGDNTWLYILAVVMAIVLLFTMVIALSDSNKQSNTSDAETTEEVEVDTIAVALPDDEVVSKENKVTWDFAIAKDDMYDTNNVWANIKSNNYISQSFPYEGYTYATICVRYMKKYGYDVIITISKGQIHGSRYNGDNYITARFDEGSPKKYYFNEAADGSSDNVFLNSKLDFIKRCKQAKDIKIDIPIYQAGRPTFTFHVDEPLVWRNE